MRKKYKAPSRTRTVIVLEAALLMSLIVSTGVLNERVEVVTVVALRRLTKIENKGIRGGKESEAYGEERL